MKECLRALANPKGGLKPKYRDTKLTRMLEDVLAPSARVERRRRESRSVMLVNICPAAHLEQPTLNAIRYGQLFTVGAVEKGGMADRLGGTGGWDRTRGRRAALSRGLPARRPADIKDSAPAAVAAETLPAEPVESVEARRHAQPSVT